MKKFFMLFAGLLLALSLSATMAMATDLIQIEPEYEKPVVPTKAPVATPAPTPTKEPKAGKRKPAAAEAPEKDDNASFVPSQRAQTNNTANGSKSQKAGQTNAHAVQLVEPASTMPPVLFATDPVTGEIIFDLSTGEPIQLIGEELDAARAQWANQSEEYRQRQRQEVEGQMAEGDIAIDQLGLDAEFGIPEEEINAMDLDSNVMRSLRIKSSLPIGSVVNVGDQCELTAVPMGFGDLNYKIQWQRAEKDADGNLSDFHNVSGAYGTKYQITFTDENIADHWRAVIKVVS